MKFRINCLEAILPAAGFLVIIIATWGYFVGRTGFYWDDWPVIWLYRELGIDGIGTYYSSDRPLYGYVYSLLMPVFGNSRVIWLVLLLLFVFMVAITWHGLLLDLWPRQRLRAWLAAGFLVVFPGFVHHGISLTYLPHFISGFFFLVSLRASVAAASSAGRRIISWTIVATVTALLSFFLVEYFVGLELARPYVLFLVLRRRLGSTMPVRNILLRIGALWIPTLATLVALVLHQFFGQKALDYRNAAALANKLKESPSVVMFDQLTTALHNVVTATVLAWVKPFEQRLGQFAWGKSVIVSWFVMFFVAVVIITVANLGWRRSPNTAEDSESTTRECGYLIVLLLATAGLPFAYACLNIDLESPTADRYSIPFMFGSSLLLAQLISWFSLHGKNALIIGSCIIGASSAYQFRATNELRSDWEIQRNIFWQFAWRFPELLPGTTVYADGLPFSLSGNHAGANLNLLYGNTRKPGNLDFFILDLNRRYVQNWAPIPVKGESTAGHIRSFAFHGTTSQAVVMWCPITSQRFKNPMNASVRFVDAESADEIPFLSPESRRLSDLSSPNRVMRDGYASDTNPACRPLDSLLDIIGPEPSHSWSYHFQKAELARQYSNWDQIVKLQQSIEKNNFAPEDPTEWYPFIEAHLRRGDITEALHLTGRSLSADYYNFSAMSHLWKRVTRNMPDLVRQLRNTDADLARRLSL